MRESPVNLFMAPIYITVFQHEQRDFTVASKNRAQVVVWSAAINCGRYDTGVVVNKS